VEGDNEEVIDLYDSDEEIVQSSEYKPFSAVIIGKPGSGKSTAASLLGYLLVSTNLIETANQLHSTLIQPELAIQHEMQAATELGKEVCGY